MFQHQQDFQTRPVCLVEDVCTQTRNVETTSAGVCQNSTSKMESAVSYFIDFVKIISENTGKFLLRDLAALTNSIYCNSQCGPLMNRFPVMMTPIGWRKFPTIF